MSRKRLRSGYTTGACAAAAAKAATHLLFGGGHRQDVEIPFPDGSRVRFALCRSGRRINEGKEIAFAAVIKDAGDDPDVTNGAEILAEAAFPHPPGTRGEHCIELDKNLLLCAGAGIGTVTKPGLAVPPGEPAINPVPRRMIAEAVAEITLEYDTPPLQITISIPRGESLAEKTLNHRLGIVGGLSILGTTGIVRPVSAEAWTATIKACLSVAREAGLDEVVLSTGRTSESGARQVLSLPEEAYIMMGDYLEFSLLEADQAGFSTIHLAGMWAKIVKAALEIPQTHVRHGALETRDCLALLIDLGCPEKDCRALENANTAREIFEFLHERKHMDIIEKVCRRAKKYAEKTSGRTVRLYLVSNRSRVIINV